jgi:hypothetical protein
MHDFYTGASVVAGMWSRGNDFFEGGVAQADFWTDVPANARCADGGVAADDDSST